VGFPVQRRLRGSISADAVSAIAAAIQTQEGYAPGTLAYRNNNPGNLRYAGQPGATPGAGGFAAFSSYPAGQAALKNQIALDAVRGTDVNGNPTTTVAELIGSWAPPSENDTSAYIASVAAQTGYDPNAALSSLGSPVLPASVALPSFSPDTSGDAGGLSDWLNSTVDLSGMGLPSIPVPFLVVGGSLLALMLFR
jgi:hypothetical protein